MGRKLVMSLRRKDFEVEWFNGKGKGGQHRNKHANCCRIRHKDTGIQVECTEFKSREQNKKTAFRRLADKLIEHYFPNTPKSRITTRERVRTYHEERGKVKDHKTGVVKDYEETLDGNLDDFIKARQEMDLPG